MFANCLSRVKAYGKENDMSEAPKAKIGDSEAQEEGVSENPFGAPITWSLATLPLLGFRILVSHILVFLGLAFGTWICMKLPSAASFARIMLSLFTVAYALSIAKNPRNPNFTEVSQAYMERVRTLVNAELMYLFFIVAIGVFVGFLVPFFSSPAGEGGSGVGRLLLMAGGGVLAGFAISGPLFLTSVVLDGGLSATNSLWVSFKLFFRHLLGNVALLLICGAVLLLPPLVLPEFPGAEVINDFYLSCAWVYTNVVITVRYLQLKARHPQEFVVAGIASASN
jgi:hypothetical protein